MAKKLDAEQIERARHKSEKSSRRGRKRATYRRPLQKTAVVSAKAV